MGTSAVAIIELLIGLSVAATYSGLTKRHENASSCRSTPDVVALQAGSVLVGNVIDLRSLLADPGRVLPDTRRGRPARTRSARATSLSVLSWHWDVFVRLAGHDHQPTTRKGKHCNAVHGSEPVPCRAPRRPECSRYTGYLYSLPVQYESIHPVSGSRFCERNRSSGTPPAIAP